MKYFFRFFLFISLLTGYCVTSAMEVPSLKKLCLDYVTANAVPSTVTLPAEAHAEIETVKFLSNNQDNAHWALQDACKKSASIDTIANLAIEANETDETLFFYAAQFNHIPLLQRLIDGGIDIHLEDELALRSAINNGNLEAAQLLLIKGAKLDCRYKGKTLVMIATKNQDKKTLCWLLEKKLPIDIQDNNGRTAVIQAAMCSDYEIIQVLLDHGADINIADHKDNTALDYALQIQDSNTINVLKKNKAINNKYILWLGKAGIWDVYSKKKVHLFLGSAAVTAGLGLLKYLRK